MAAPKKEASVKADKPKLTKAQRFHNLAIKRLRKAFRMLDLIGNLGAYKPTADQQHVMMEALHRRLVKTEQGLAGKGVGEDIQLPE